VVWEDGGGNPSSYPIALRALLLQCSVRIEADQMNAIWPRERASRRIVAATARNCIEIPARVGALPSEYPGGALTLAGAAQQTLAK